MIFLLLALMINLKTTNANYYKGPIMSGGHFDYKQVYLGYIADQLEEDIQYNDVSWEEPVKVDDEEYSGYQFSQETIAYMKDTVQQLRDLESTLQELDLAMSGDSGEETLKSSLNIQHSVCLISVR